MMLCTCNDKRTCRAAWIWDGSECRAGVFADRCPLRRSPAQTGPQQPTAEGKTTWSVTLTLQSKALAWSMANNTTMQGTNLVEMEITLEGKAFSNSINGNHTARKGTNVVNGNHTTLVI